MSAADAPTVNSHRSAAVAEAALYRGSARLFDPATFIEQFTLVACVDDVVVGSCTCSTLNDDAFVTHVYVDPDARSVGVGDALMREVLVRATSKTGMIKAVALPGDRETKNLFERHGLTAQTIVVGRKLRD